MEPKGDWTAIKMHLYIDAPKNGRVKTKNTVHVPLLNVSPVHFGSMFDQTSIKNTIQKIIKTSSTKRHEYLSIFTYNYDP